VRARLIAFCSLLSLLTAARAHAQCNNDFILISTSDFSASSSSTLDPVTKTATIGVETTYGLSALRYFGGRVYAVSDELKLQGLDPCNNFDNVFVPIAVLNTPRDIVVVSPMGYVTRYDRNSILKVNPGGGFAGEISLAAVADADGLPEMDQMFAYGGRLYVCLQRTTHANGNPTGTSMLAVIDLATETLLDMDPVTGGIQGIPLLLQKPGSEINFRLHGGVHKAYFSAAGLTAVYDGGVIECVAADPFNQSVILTEMNAGGDVLDVEIVSDTKGFAIVVTPTSTMELIAFNPSTGLKIGATMFTVPGDFRFITDIEPSSLGLLLADLNLAGSSGIRCFDMTTNLEIPGGPISTGLPPFDILIRKGSTTDTDDTPAVTSLGQNYPNPFNPETSIPFSLASAGHVVLRIYDVTGALVATLVDEHRETGKHVARWNGRTDSAVNAPTGVYFVRLHAANTVATRKLVLLK
jgi:hypothetical protein